MSRNTNTPSHVTRPQWLTRPARELLQLRVKSYASRKENDKRGEKKLCAKGWARPNRQLRRTLSSCTNKEGGGHHVRQLLRKEKANNRYRATSKCHWRSTK